jgi:hypothetical protein
VRQTAKPNAKAAPAVKRITASGRIGLDTAGDEHGRDADQADETALDGVRAM